MKKVIFFLAIFLLSLAVKAQQSSQDVIYLKNGTVVRGKIVEHLPNQGIKVYTANRTMVEFRADEIEKTETEKGSQDLVPVAEEAPTKEGNMIIGGSANIEFQKSKYEYPGYSDTYKDFTIGIYPLVDYFIADNLAIGGSVTLGLTTSSGKTNFNIGIGPEIRYYFDSGLLLKAETGIVYGSQNSDISFSIKPGVGYAIFLNSKVALEPCLIYQFSSEKLIFPSETDKNKSSRFGIEIGLVIFL